MNCKLLFASLQSLVGIVGWRGISHLEGGSRVVDVVVVIDVAVVDVMVMDVVRLEEM
jgi:hypothetical protein